MISWTRALRPRAMIRSSDLLLDDAMQGNNAVIRDNSSTIGVDDHRQRYLKLAAVMLTADDDARRCHQNLPASGASWSRFSPR